MTHTEDLIARLRDTASRGVSSWGDLQQEAADQIEALMNAVAAEREACAKVCEQHGYEHYCGNVTDKLAETIRARSGEQK